jgi:type I restriction enzyme S subunit
MLEREVELAKAVPIPSNAARALLPDGWGIAPLSSVTLPTRQINPTKSPRQTIRYIDVSAVSSKSLSVTRSEWFTGQDAPLRARKAVKSGDIIFATVRPALRRVARIPTELDGALCSTAFAVIRPNVAEADPTYLFFACSSDDFVRRVAAHQRGSSYPAVTDKDVLRERIPIPPMAEQHAIASVLSVVQQSKEAARSVIEAATEMKKSLIHHLLTHGAVPLEAAKDVPLTETEYGSVPSSWKRLSLAECATVQTGVAKGRKLAGNLVSAPYLRVANVQDGYLDLSDIKNIQLAGHELDRYRLKAGDVLLTEGGDFDKLGRGTIWEGQIPNCVHQNHIFAVRSDASRLLPKFLAFLIQSSYGKAYFRQVAHRTTHLACINSAKLKAFPVVVPEIREQERIVQWLEVVEEKIRSEEQRCDVIQGILDLLLYRLLDGTIRLATAGGQGSPAEEDSARASSRG